MYNQKGEKSANSNEENFKDFDVSLIANVNHCYWGRNESGKWEICKDSLKETDYCIETHYSGTHFCITLSTNLLSGFGKKVATANILVKPNFNATEVLRYFFKNIEQYRCLAN